MSHRHFCDYEGHYWDCEGPAVRLFAPEASVCMCLNHGVPMEEGDHSECSVELLSCPKHRADHMRAMGYDPEYTVEPRDQDAEGSPMFKDEAGIRIVGFCLWCNKNFYSMDESEAHTANEMADCPVFQELKDQHFMPPVLEMMLEDVRLRDDEAER